MLVWLLITVCGPSALSQEPLGDDTVDFAGRISRLTPYFKTQNPSGTGPFPAMIMVTGCSGFHNERFSASYDRDGNRFVELGYVVTRVDFVRAHGLDNSCVGDQNPTGKVVPYDDVAEYILATIDHMAARSEVDSDRIYLIGWSMGGSGIMTALNKFGLSREPNIAAVLTYFPACEGLSPWNAQVPMLLMLAELDNLAPPQFCKNVVRDVIQAEFVEIVEYPNAHHCFIAEDTPVVTEARAEPTCAYNPKALRASWQDILDFLDTH